MLHSRLLLDDDGLYCAASPPALDLRRCHRWLAAPPASRRASPASAAASGPASGTSGPPGAPRGSAPSSAPPRLHLEHHPAVIPCGTWTCMSCVCGCRTGAAATGWPWRTWGYPASWGKAAEVSDRKAILEFDREFARTPRHLRRAPERQRARPLPAPAAMLLRSSDASTPTARRELRPRGAQPARSPATARLRKLCSCGPSSASCLLQRVARAGAGAASSKRTRATPREVAEGIGTRPLAPAPACARRRGRCSPCQQARRRAGRAGGDARAGGPAQPRLGGGGAPGSSLETADSKALIPGGGSGTAR